MTRRLLIVGGWANGSWSILSRVHFCVSCAEFVDLFLAYARSYYIRPDGTQTRQATNFEIALRWWRRADWPAEAVGLDELLEYRRLLQERGLSSRTINQYVGWVRHAFRWAAEVGHIPPSVPASMAVLRPLRARGRRPSHRDAPVSMDTLRAVADYLDRRGRAGDMVRVQWLTGARPGEIRRMAWSEFKAAGGSLVYRPTRHKIEHHGLARVLILVPEAVGYLGPRGEGFVFQTRLGGPYSSNGYAQSLARASEALGAERVTPASIRRAAATAARALGGAEGAQRLLGHTTTTMTEQYLELGWVDALKDVERMRDLGWQFRRSP